MSRVLRESNVAQAMREIVQSIALIPVGLLGIVTHRVTTYGTISSGVYLLILAVAVSITVRECGWLLSKYFWERRMHSGYTATEARQAARRDYVKWAALHTTIFLVSFVPLVLNFVWWYITKRRVWSIFDDIEPFFIGIIVGFLTGDILSGGLIAGVEWWGARNSKDFNGLPGTPLIVLYVVSVGLCAMHAVRTILALVGVDVRYLAYLKAVRWAYDSHSEQLANRGMSGAVLATTARQPYLVVEGETAHFRLTPRESRNGSADFRRLGSKKE